MRKNLEAVSLGALVLLFWITWHALTGPTRLPDRIPTHFDFAGHANGWGSPAMLWLFPVVAVGLYLLMTVVVRFPSTFNYPVPVTAENRPRLEALTLSMTTWIKAEILCLFTWIQWMIVTSARQGRNSLSLALMPVCTVAILATVGWHIAAMFRAAKVGGRS
ncbi:MAG: DUF1648 domain-containing protein [Terracidiphilus sp.]|nr:DUF1648 domain-containing protein [Terracidiphilus sp.]